VDCRLRGGLYTDPQLGTQSKLASLDLSRSDNEQIYQELRLQSNNDGRFNFSLGANYTEFESKDDYFVFNNLFTIIAEYLYNDNASTLYPDTVPCTTPSTTTECVGVDYTSLDRLDGNGHNYFRSKNEVSTRSWGVFGEGYWDLSPEFRLTVGLRYTDDKKVTSLYPSQLLLGTRLPFGYGLLTGGNTSWGYPSMGDLTQRWDAVTGRLVLDWKPSEDQMYYASFSRGYKGGGANPPRADINSTVLQYQPLPETFDPEYVNAFEIGAKTSWADGAVRLNATAFYYDYKDYQVSQIQDRIALNENYDTTSAGFELEFVYRPNSSFRLDANFGYLKTRIDDGEASIDIMNRTAGNDDYMVIRPWVQVPSNCIAPRALVERIYNHALGATQIGDQAVQALCGGSFRSGTFDPSQTLVPLKLHNLFGFTYVPFEDAPNGGRGIATDLSGNELPNAPRWTANVGAQYTWHFSNSELTLRGDYYRQAESYFRVYNTDYDRLKGWGNANLSVTWEHAPSAITVQAYVKNLFDDDPIVDAFLNGDDSLLTTNVFTLDPRLWGFSLTKRF